MGTSELAFCRSEQVQNAEEQESGDETPAVAAADTESVQQATAAKPKSAAAFKPRPAKSSTRPRARVNNTKNDHSKRKASTK